MLVFIFVGSILEHVGATGEIKDYVKRYFSISIYGIPVMFLSMSIVFIINTIGSTVNSMVLSLIANIVNLILCPILMFTFDLGSSEVAWATLFQS